VVSAVSEQQTRESQGKEELEKVRSIC